MGSILDPFYKSQTAGIAFSNAMTACQFTTAATKIHLRLSPTGTTDLAYLLINVIKEGFFQKMNDQTIKNQIWDALYTFLQGIYIRSSMSCLDVGFEMGLIVNGLLGFTVPDAILTKGLDTTTSA